MGVHNALMRLRNGRLALGAVVATSVALVVPTVAPAKSVAAGESGNSVVEWHGRAQEAMVDVAALPPWIQVRGFAMLGGALYDALNAIDGKPYQPYLIAPRARRWYSKDAAVATAAYRVLVDLLPDQQESLGQQYEDSLAEIPDGPAKAGGIAVGDQAAGAMLAAREDDGSDGTQEWLVGGQPGQWRPTPPDFLSVAASTGFTTPFLLPRADMFRTPGPNSLSSAEYAADFIEIKEIGSADSTTRTPDQTDAATFWASIHQPWWGIYDQLAITQRLDESGTARMLAMANLAAEDANIACFEDKFHWGFWRPVTAIREADSDGNAATVADPGWEPLLYTPPFPEHPSGHACGSTAIARALRNFFGRDDIAFTGHSVDTGSTRRYRRFSQAGEEVVDARVWGGIHFRTADDQGAVVGEKIAAYEKRNFFRRTR